MPRTLQSSTSKAYIQKDYYILYIRKKDLSYDYTYLDSRDSVTILMTITTSVPYKPDNIDITNNSGTQKSSVSGNTKILYVESQMKNWRAKIRTTIGYSEWTNIYKLAHIRMKFGGIMQTVGNER